MTKYNEECEKYREMFESSLPCELKELQKDIEIKEHLDICEDCRAVFQKAEKLNMALDAYPMPAPKKNIQASVMAKIAQMEKEKAASNSSGNFFKHIRALFNYKFHVPALAAAVLLLLLFGSGALNIILMNRKSAQPEAIVLNTQNEAESQNQFNNPEIKKTAQGMPHSTPYIIDTGAKSSAGNTGETISAAIQAVSKINQIQPAIVIIMGMPPDFAYPELPSKTRVSAMEEIKKNKEINK